MNIYVIQYFDPSTYTHSIYPEFGYYRNRGSADVKVEELNRELLALLDGDIERWFREGGPIYSVEALSLAEGEQA